MLLNTVVQHVHGHKQRTLEPPALSLRTVETYVPLRAEGSESVPAVVCTCCATSLEETSISPSPTIRKKGAKKHTLRCAITGQL